MRISRIYLQRPLESGHRIEFDHDSAHYVRDVLRLAPGATIVLFNGNGGEFAARLLEVGRKSVVAEIGEWDPRESESSLPIEFGLAVSRGERMDFAVQKAVELGVHGITPLITERTVVQLKGDRKEQKRRHWQKVAESAAEQCGRNRVPHVAAPQSLMDWIDSQKGRKIFLDPRAEKTLDQLGPAPSCVTLLSGPEGGFSTQERETAIETGFVAVRMGPRILRAETASLAALTAVQLLWGDLGARD